MTRTILIVDDDTDHCAATERLVLNLGYSAVCVSSGAAALEVLDPHSNRRIDAVILDMVMPDLDGMAVLERMRKALIYVPVIVQSTASAIDTVQSALRAGARDFILKPVGIERLSIALVNLLRQCELETELRSASRIPRVSTDIDNFLELNPSIRNLRNSFIKAAESDGSILIEGLPGVGKATLARALHGSSRYRDKAFVSFDCANMDDGSFANQLFGNGTDRVVADHFSIETVHAKTIFLSNVQGLSEPSQRLLLEWLDQSERSTRSGPQNTIRIISSVTGSALEFARSGKLLESLYYRLGIYQFTLMPFSVRHDDVVRSAFRLLYVTSAETGRFIRSIDPQAIDILLSYSWYENARELERVITRAAAICDGDQLTVSDIRPFIAPRSDFRLTTQNFPEPQVNKAAIFSARRSDSSIKLTGTKGDLRALHQIENAILQFALGHYGGRITDIARDLGIGRSTLYRKLKQAGIVHSADATAIMLDQAA